MSSSIDLPPSGQSQPAQPAPSGQSQSPAAVLRADAAVTQALSRGTVLQGTVTGTPTVGQVTVQTPAGSVTLQTAVELPANSPVTLQPGTGEGQIRLSLPQSQTGTQTGTQAAGQLAATERPPAVVTTLTQGATVTATAVNPPGTGPQQPPQPQTPAGQQAPPQPPTASATAAAQASSPSPPPTVQPASPAQPTATTQPAPPPAGQQTPPQPPTASATAAVQASSPNPSPTVQPASPAQPTPTTQPAPPPQSNPAQAPSPPQTSAQSTPAQSAPAQSAPAPQQSASAPAPSGPQPTVQSSGPTPSSGSASASGSSTPSGPSSSAGSRSTTAPQQQPAPPPAQSSGASQPSAAPPSSQPSPVQSTPVQSAPAQPAPVQPTPVQPTPAAPPATPPPPIQNAPTQNAPVQNAPAQPAPPTAGQPSGQPPTVQIPPSQAPLPQQPIVATVVTASPSLSRVLIAGQTVQGTVTAVPQGTPAAAQGTAPPSAGPVTVQTTFGTITLRLPIAVPPGSGLTLTTTGKAPLQTVQVSFTAPGTENPSIPGQAAGPQAAPTPSAAGAGTSAGTGAGAKTTATATNPAQGPAGATPSAQSNAATAGSIAAGSTVPVRLAAILPPGTPAPAVAGLTNSAAPGLPVVIGSVIGETASGAALVRTPLGHFSVPVGSRPVPSGTTLVLEFTAQPTPPAAGGAVHAGQAVARQVGGGPFQALQEALALLQQADPGAAQQIAQSLIPTAGPQLGTALLFLLQAVRLGGAPRWLGGDAVRTLERARRGSVDRLSRDLGALRGKAMDSAGGEWRSYQLPVSVGGEIEALKLYLRDKENQSQDEGREKTKTGQRFIIEVNFTRLGPFQFDNIVEKKHIDLMIRTHAALPSDMRRDIQTLFADTVTALGLTGQVGYHVVKSFDLTAVDGPSGSDGVREDLSI